MTLKNKTSYDLFWKELYPAYLISKGSIRLPISTSLTELPNFNHRKFQQELHKILQKLLDSHGDLDKAVLRAKDNRDENLIPLMTAEYTGVVRFDCIWNPQSQQTSILEINCDYPDGLILHDKTYSVLDKSPCTLHTGLLNNLFSESKNIHLLYSKTASFLDSYYAEKNQLSKKHTVTIGSNSNKIKKNTTVRRCLETTKLSSTDIYNIHIASARLVNTMSLRTFGYKNLLADINHPFIPKTIRVTSETINYCLSNRENLVLKPTNGCEGRNIYFGKDLSDNAWSEQLKSTISQNYITQKLVTIPKQNVSFYEDGGIVTKKLYSDLCPHFFIKNGQIIGSGHTLIRFSENKIVNISQGGGIGYYKL